MSEKENTSLEHPVEMEEKEEVAAAASEAGEVSESEGEETGVQNSASQEDDETVEEPLKEEKELSPEEKVAELQNKIIRMQADFDNFRKRLHREKEDMIRYSNQSLLEDLLPVIDNFELGLKAAETSSDTKSIVMGMQMVKTQLDRFLSDVGVEKIEAVGELFDPHLHEAVAHEPSDEVEEGKVLEQRRKGYKLKDRLLRPASVVVAKASEQKA